MKLAQKWLEIFGGYENENEGVSYKTPDFLVSETQTMQAGFVPYAMLFRGEDGKYDLEWRRFQREWCRPIITGKKFNEYWRGKP